MQIQGSYHLIDGRSGNSISQWKVWVDLFCDAAFSQELIGHRRSHTECSYGLFAWRGAWYGGDAMEFCSYGSWRSW